MKRECKKFGENSRQMAPVSTICDEYCSSSWISSKIDRLCHVTHSPYSYGTFRPWWCGPPFMGGDSNVKHNIMSDFFHAGKLY